MAQLGSTMDCRIKSGNDRLLAGRRPCGESLRGA
jgi:hypothetical protein